MTAGIKFSPFVTIILGAALEQEPLDRGKLGGMAIGFVGVLLIAGGRGAFPGNLAGIGLAVLGTVSFCFGAILFGARAATTPILQTNFHQSVSAALSLGAIALVSRAPFVRPTAQAMAIIVYLALVVTIVGLALWLSLIRSIGAATTSSLHLLNPAVGLVLSYLVLGDPIRLTDVVGSAVIAAGLLVVLGRRESSS